MPRHLYAVDDSCIESNGTQKSAACAFLCTHCCRAFVVQGTFWCTLLVRQRLYDIECGETGASGYCVLTTCKIAGADVLLDATALQSLTRTEFFSWAAKGRDPRPRLISPGCSVSRFLYPSHGLVGLSSATRPACYIAGPYSSPAYMAAEHVT